MANAARIDTALHSNLTTAIMLTKAYRQKGCAARGGSIVLLSSVAGLAGQVGISINSASNAALIGFVRSAALELAQDGLRVNSVAPGYFDTEMGQRFREALTDEQYGQIQAMHPLVIGQPRDVANAIAFCWLKPDAGLPGQLWYWMAVIQLIEAVAGKRVLASFLSLRCSAGQSFAG